MVGTSQRLRIELREISDTWMLDAEATEYFLPRFEKAVT